MLILCQEYPFFSKSNPGADSSRAISHFTPFFSRYLIVLSAITASPPNPLPVTKTNPLI